MLVLAHLGDVAGREDAAQGRIHDVGVDPADCVVVDLVHPRGEG